MELNCSECCSRYFITLLPAEAKSITEQLNLSLNKFIEEYCQLYLQLFKAEKQKSDLVVPSQLIPKKISDSFERIFGALPSRFLVLPALALKRGKSCVFLKCDKCRIYNSRPSSCRVFPFVSLKKDDFLEFKKLYPFCKALEEGKLYKNHGKKHKAAVEKHFNRIEKKGFRPVWKHLPARGIAGFEDKKLCTISRKEFLQAVQQFYE